MTTENTNEYFDLITTGLGYLNRSRLVTPKQGSPYESVTIAALHGNTENPHYSYFDTRVVGTDVIEFVKKYRDHINNRDTKVLVKFNIGDGQGDSYEATKGNHVGERFHLIKGRLLKITWAKVGDTVVIERNRDESESHQAKSTSPEGSVDSAADDVPSDAKGLDEPITNQSNAWGNSYGYTVSI
jgi:hypothetical protein